MQQADPTTPRLLLIEDDLDAALMIREVLDDHFAGDPVRHVMSLSQAMEADLMQIDLVLCDVNLPDGRGLELLEAMLNKRPDLPVVMVTSETVSDTAIAAIQCGAYDYVVKAGDYLFALPVIVQKNLALWRTKQTNARLERELRLKNEQLEQAVSRLQTMAATDPLTGLVNRRAFAAQSEQRFAEARRYDHDLAVTMIDLDNFKQLNDACGHQAGDRMLEKAARVIEANSRQSDVAGRFGGDEFILLLPRTDMQTAAGVARRIGEEFAAMTAAECQRLGFSETLTMSMGLATRHANSAGSPEQLIGLADHALYRAKRQGKGRLFIYTFHVQPDNARDLDLQT